MSIRSWVTNSYLKLYWYYLKFYWFWKCPIYEWASLSKRTSMYFARQDMVNSTNIDFDHISQINDRFKKIRSMVNRILILNYTFICVLMLSAVGAKIDIRFMGINAESLLQFREVALSISATLFLAEAFYSVHSSILYNYMKEIADIRLPENRAILFYNTNDFVKHIAVKLRVTSLTYLLAILSIVLMALIYVISYFLIFIGVYIYIIIDIYNTPSFPSPWSDGIIFYAAFTTILAYFYVPAMYYIPFRELRLKYSLEMDAARKKGASAARRYRFDLLMKEARYKGVFFRLVRKRIGY